VSITGTEDRLILSNLKQFKRSPVRVVFGDPLRFSPVPREGREQVLEGYTDEIMCQIAAMLPEEYRGVYKDYPRLKQLLDIENQDQVVPNTQG
jgi:1-acyl-sn-glycerol-3-phosphate acyltransferase